MKKLSGNYNVDGAVVKDNETYLLKDNTTLNKLIVSSTTLKAGKQTNGHKHKGQEEVYMFIHGSGEMQIDLERFTIQAGDIILIEDNEFHRVYNTTNKELYFVCVFDGGRNH